jgi:hypothetical protein
MTGSLVIRLKSPVSSFIRLSRTQKDGSYHNFKPECVPKVVVKNFKPPSSVFQLRTSDFGLPPSCFRLLSSSIMGLPRTPYNW